MKQRLYSLFGHWTRRIRTKLHSRFCVAFAAFTIALAGNVSAEMIVAPNEFTSTDAPAAEFTFGASNNRWQNVYNASEFINSMPLGATITHIAFRVDASDRTSFDAVILDLEVRMSTSPSTAPVLSLMYDANVGPDQTVVFPRSSLPLIVGPSESGPNPFTVIVPLATPFGYNPNAGNLAVDLFIYEGANRRLLIDSETGNNAAALVGLIDSPLGRGIGFGHAPVIQLEFVPIPEPSTVALLLMGLGFILMRRRLI